MGGLKHLTSNDVASAIHRGQRPLDNSVPRGQQGHVVDHPSNAVPIVVCFHGSGDNPLPAWDDFVKMARHEYTIVLLDRGQQKISTADANLTLLKHLKAQQMHPPYVLVAHSYGGAFAKMLLHQTPEVVAGMLLVETGQEGGLPDNVERSLSSRIPLGNKPLAIIRGNSLITSWKALQTAEAAAGTVSVKAELNERRRVLEACDVEDDRLKKAQLQMSGNTKFVHLPDCGHGVVRDRPDVVLEELRWVIANLQPEAMSTNVWTKFKQWWQAFRAQ